VFFPFLRLSLQCYDGTLQKIFNADGHLHRIDLTTFGLSGALELHLGDIQLNESEELATYTHLQFMAYAIKGTQLESTVQAHPYVVCNRNYEKKNFFSRHF
jgi:hypothetical protein